MNLVDSSNPSGMGGLHWDTLYGLDHLIIGERARGVSLDEALRCRVWLAGEEVYDYTTRRLTADERAFIRSAWPSDKD